MALNIPNTGAPGEGFLKGLDSGGSLFQKIMAPRIAREQLQQKQQQFMQELALRKQAEARMGANSGLTREILQQQLLGLKHKNDPNYEFQQFQALQNMMASGGQNQSGMSSPQQMPQPTQGMGEGMGMFSPEGLQEAQQQQPSTKPQTQGGLNLEMFRQHPMLRGWAKKHLGYDPLAQVPQTPQEKEQMAVNQAVSIDEAKSTRKKLDEIEKTAQALLPYLGKVNTIDDILQRKPELAGRTTQLADIMGMTKDEDVGTFLSAAQNLQAHMAKEMSSRGGYGVSKLVEQAKPNIGKSTAYNKGVIKELKAGMKESFNQMKSEYERLSNGKKFPYNFEQYFNEVTGSEAASKKRLKFNPATGRLE